MRSGNSNVMLVVVVFLRFTALKDPFVTEYVICPVWQKELLALSVKKYWFSLEKRTGPVCKKELAQSGKTHQFSLAKCIGKVWHSQSGKLKKYWSSLTKT